MTTMVHYLHGGSVLVGVDVNLERYTDYFSTELTAVPVADNQPELMVRPREEVHDAPLDRIFGTTGGVTGEAYLVPDNRGHWCEVPFKDVAVGATSPWELRPCCDRFSPTVLLEWLIIPLAHFHLAKRGYAPLHASSASVAPMFPGPIIFSAWSGVGKTNLVLSALSSAPGGSYYGDDQVIVSNRGDVLPSSRTISVYGYNRRLAPNVGAGKRTRLAAGEAVKALARREQTRIPRLSKLLIYASDTFSNVRVNASVFGTVPSSLSAVKAHVRCWSSPSVGAAALSLAPSAKESDLAAQHLAVMEYEYVEFRRYLQTWRWATTASHDPWALLSSLWHKSLCEYFESVPIIYDLILPNKAVTPALVSDTLCLLSAELKARGPYLRSSAK